MGQQVLRHTFTRPVDEKILRFVASVADDRHLVDCDVRGSLAHVAMLEKCGVLTSKQAANLRRGLRRILKEGLELKLEHEDVHMAVEKRLEEIIGPDARLLHTARSRNDQVATDLRLFVAERQKQLREELAALCRALADRADPEIIMPGYTHLQRAQPVVFGHVMLAFYEMFQRDIERLTRPFICPLGAGALAGTAIPIDPKFTARQLGADGVFQNSMDAVSDRDFAVEFVFACSLIAVHLSQLAENLILWCTREFDFIRLPDELTTGSSIMPQKKNPDCLELVRGRAGRTVGELVNLLVTLKALPLGYNRDLQETKPPVIRVAQTVSDCIRVCTLAVRRMTLNKDAMLKAASDEALFATDVVEDLVANGTPFRDAHTKVAEMVRDGRRLPQKFIDPAKSVRSRKSHGGTSPDNVRMRLKELK